jgi:arginase
VSARVVILRGRTSDRTAGGARGAEALGELLADAPERVGAPEPPRAQGYADDLRDSRAAIAAAGERLEAALEAGELPVLLASDCSICLSTLPALARREPDARVVWLDAHGDFNTPATTGSGFLGGMCLAAACGRWESGFGAGLDPRRAVMSDGRDLDPAEREEIERAGVSVVAPAGVAEAVRGERVFLHLDFDILDPEVMPAGVPAPGGLSAGELRDLLSGLAGAAELVGVELTAFEAPEDPAERDRMAALLAGVVAPLLPAR